MVKNIPAKRADKGVSVGDFWKAKEQLKQKTKEKLKKKQAQIDISQIKRFKTQREKVRNVDFDIGHRIDEIKILPHSFDLDQIGSFWLDEINQQQQILMIKSFNNFYNEVFEYSQNLSLVIHNLDKIIEIVLKYLQIQECQKIILDIMPALIRDCQQDIYTQFRDKILIQLFNLIDIRNTEVLEKVFVAIAFAFKYLFKDIQKDVTKIFEIYLKNLLNHKNKHIREFSSQSFGYILQSLSNEQRYQTLELILQYMRTEQDNKCFESVGFMFYILVRGVGNFLSSKSIDIFQNIFKVITDNIFEGSMIIFEQFFQNLSHKISHKELDNMIAFNFNDLFNLFVKLYKEKYIIINQDTIGYYLSLVKILYCKIKHFRDQQYQDNETINIISWFLTNIMSIYFDQSYKNEEFEQIYFKVLGYQIRYCYELQLQDNIMNQDIKEYILNKISIKNTYNFIKSLTRFYEVDVYEMKYKVIEDWYNIPIELYHMCLLSLIRNLTENPQFQDFKDQEFVKISYLLSIINKHSNNNQQLQLNENQNFQILFEQIKNNFKNDLIEMTQKNTFKIEIFQQIFCLQKLFQIIKFQKNFQIYYSDLLLKCNDILNNNEDLVFHNQEDLKGFYDFNENDFSKYAVQKFQNINCLSQIELNQIVKSQVLMNLKNTDLDISFLLQEIKYFSGSKSVKNPFFLKIFSELLINQMEDKNLPISEYQGLYNKLVENLACKYHEIRLPSLKLLNLFDYKCENNNFQNQPDDMKKIIELLLVIENTDVNLQTERTIKFEISKIIVLIQQKNNITNSQLLLIMNYFCGYSFIRFQLLWETISEALTLCLKVTVQKSFQNVFEQFLQNLAFYNFLSHQPKEELVESSQIFDTDFLNLMQDDYYFKGDSIDYNLALETLFNSLINSNKICDINCHKLLDFIQSFIDNEIISKLNPKNKLQMMKLEKFLKIFENFHQIPNQNLFNFFLTCMRQDHEKLQLQALNCIKKYGKESINIYKQDLQKLITKESFKSQQVEFSISSEIDFVKLEHRKDVIPLVISIMYPRLFMQRGLKHKNQLDVQRNMVYQFFQSLEPSELQILIDFLMRDNNVPEELQFFEISEIRFSVENKEILANVGSKNIMRLLTNMKNMIEKLEYLLAPYLHQLYSVLMALLSQCNNKTIVQNLNEREIKEVNKQCVERLIQLLKRFDQFEKKDVLIDYLVIIMQDKINQITSDNVSQVSGIFKIIVIFSEIPSYQNFFIKYRLILESVIEILSNPKAVLSVIQSSQQILLNLYEEQNTTVFLNTNYQQLIIQNTFNYILNYQKQSKSKRFKINDQSLSILSFATENLDGQISQQLIESMLDNFINKMESDLKKKAPQNEEQINNQNSLIDIIGRLLEIFDRPEKYYQKFTTLIPNSSSQELRQNIFKCIKKINQKLLIISPLCIETLENLNLHETTLERKMDYDNVLKTCFLINTDYMPNLKFKMAEVELILLTYLSLTIQDDFGIKMAILAGLKQFFQQYLEKNYNDDIQIAKIFITKKLLIFILKGLKKSVNSEEQMKIYLQLFDLYIFYGNQIYKKQIEDGPIIFESKSSENYFLDFSVLQNKNDLNQDFFENIVDIQLQKRVKSMNILSKNLDFLGLKSSNILNVIKPILDYTIFTKCQEITSTNRMKITDVTQSFYKTLMQISTEIYAKTLQYLNLPQIKKIFKKFIVFLDQKEDKIMVKLINLMFDNIGHVLPEMDMVKKVSFEMRRNNQKIQDNSLMKKLFVDDVKLDEMEIEVEQDKDEFEMEDEEEMDHERLRKHKINVHREKNLIKQMEDKENKDEITNVYKFLRISILIPLKSKLFSSYNLNKISDTNTKKDKNKSKIRIHLSIAIIKLIIKFPEEIFRLEFPRIIAQICKTLKSKEQEVRDMARKILCEICKLVGPYFMHFVIKELRMHLRGGWEYHILNYTLYQILKTFEDQGLENGSLDYCLEQILPLLVEEIFGQQSEEKQLQIKVKVSETKKSKAFECMHILAKYINFDGSIITFLGFLKKEIVENMDCSKNVYRFQQLFHNIIEGFNKNKSIRRDPLLIISYGLIRDSQQVIENSKKINYLHETTVLSKETSAKKYNFEQNFTILEETLQNKSIFNKMKDQKKNNLMKVASELGEFGLKLVQIGIKTGIFSKQILIKDQSFKVQFEGLIVLIIKCLEAQDNNLLLNALKIIKTAVEWKSKLVKNHRKQIITSVLLIMEKLTVSDQELVQDTFRLVKMIIQTFQTDNFKPNQMKALLLYIKMFTEQSDYLSEQLLTLNLLIDIKYIHPDVYDIMIQVREKMVTCYNKSVQSHCKQIFLSFLINYPLSDKLMQNYINFLIKNTEYSFDQGREVIYEVFKTIIEKFPSDIIQNFGEIIFITFIVNKVKETNKQIIEQINSLCTLLLDKISNESKVNLLQSTMSWLNEKEKIKIVSAAYEMLKFFVDQDIFQKQSQSQSLNMIKLNILDILDFTTQTFKCYWSEQSELKNIQKNLNNSSWKDILDQDSIKFDTKYDDVIVRCMEFIILLGQKNRNYLIEFFFQEKKYFFQLMELINHQDQNIQNQVLQVINLLFEKVFEEVKQLDSDMLNQSIQKIINSLYYFKIQNNILILQSELSHKFLYNVISLNFYNGDESKAEFYFFILQKIFTKSLGKFQEKIFIVENILEFFDYITQSNENTQILKQFNCKQKIVEHIIMCIIKLKGLEEIIKKTENTILDKSETIIENLKKIIELNEFFSMYSNLRSQIQQKKKQKLQVIKEMAVVDPEQLAQLKQKLNLKKKKTNRRKDYKLKIERTMGCLPAKKVKIN